MLVLVGSDNPVKTDATRSAFARFFDPEHLVVQGVPVPSGVADQPIGPETFTGARNRALALRQHAVAEGLDAEYCVGIEGGALRLAGRWYALGCMSVVDRTGREGTGTSPLFELPGSVIERLQAGDELGEVMDRLTGQRDSKRHGGAIGAFTRGVMDRRRLYEAGLVVALVPFLNEKLFFAARRMSDRDGV